MVAADWHRGRMEEAESGFAEMLAEGRAAPGPHPLMTTCYPLGAVQRARGELGAALRTFREGLRFATEGGRFSPNHECEAHIGIAQVLYARNELDDALRHATQAVTLGRQVVESFLLALGLDAMAWIHQAMGDTEAAWEAMDEAYGILPTTAVARHIYPGEAWRARLLLALGRSGEAVRWTVDRGLTADDAISYQRERDYLVLVRVLIVRQDPAGPCGCWAAWRPSPGPRDEPRASSRHGRSGRWRRTRPGTTKVPSRRWPRRSHWPVRRGTSGSSPTRARRWPPSFRALSGRGSGGEPRRCPRRRVST
jgi:hypothetical protein